MGFTHANDGWTSLNSEAQATIDPQLVAQANIVSCMSHQVAPTHLLVAQATRVSQMDLYCTSRYILKSRALVGSH